MPRAMIKTLQEAGYSLQEINDFRLTQSIKEKWRYEFAGRAMSARIVGCMHEEFTDDPEDIAMSAVQHADALLAELKKEQP